MVEYEHVLLSASDRKYLATGCNSSFMHPDVEICKNRWRDFLIKSLESTPNALGVDLESLTESFMKIYGFYKTKTFTKIGDISSYFEGLGDLYNSGDEPGNLSHNVILYRDSNGNTPKDFLRFLGDCEICAVKVSDTQDKKTYGFAGLYEEMKFDRSYFGKEIDGRYVLTHGITENGLTVVRSITESEFEKWKDWFTQSTKHPENQFVKNKDILERRIKSFWE